MSKQLYRANFFFSINGKEYSINYFHAEAKDKFFTETIYQLPEGKPISRKPIDYTEPTAVKALQSLTILLNP